MWLQLFDIKLASISVLYNTGEKKILRQYNYLRIARLFHGPFRLAIWYNSLYKMAWQVERKDDQV